MPQTKRPFICDCGEPAIKKYGNEPVCAVCVRIQGIRDLYGPKSHTNGMEDTGKDDLYDRRASRKRPWINEPDTKPILLPEALARLEAFLQRKLSTMVDTKTG